jgi:hypothetical protein
MSKRHLVLLLWLGAQLLVVGYLVWLSEIKGVRDYHMGFLLIPTFGVLLFPGVQVVMLVLGVALWIANIFGAQPAFDSDWVAIPLDLLIWSISAWLTYRFWRWAATKGQAIVQRRREAGQPGA